MTLAVWRQARDKTCVVASSVVSEALTVLGIQNSVVPVAPFIKQSDVVEAAIADHTYVGRTPHCWVDGGHAVVACPTAGLLLDASFDQFGTKVPYLVSDFDPATYVSRDGWHYVTDAVDVRYVALADAVEVEEPLHVATRIMGRELAAVGGHVGFDEGLLMRVNHALFTELDLTERIADDSIDAGARTLESFRSARDARLSVLGYPGRVRDPGDARLETLLQVVA
ncbi:hypothetical protein [Cryobacterium zhongshanensis]|uniref:Uncharacterized protein n=1 Tax=Cryobacterium zhongshanensis TaxID=2928153 RepID=A0AA41QZB1_9MICO|nr:hypothetical protein [Cryobacterium zhongshanensis]MCI4659569.1 hypothetical protein [Cryobacterium zhongshanensis]